MGVDKNLAKAAKIGGVTKTPPTRIGDLMDALREAGKLAKGGAEKGVGRRGKKVGFSGPHILTFSDMGVDKNLAKAARQLAGATFEGNVATGLDFGEISDPQRCGVTLARLFLRDDVG